MDGTIVSFTTHKISDRDIKAINKLRESGILVFISSGRDKNNIMKVLDNTLKVDGFVGMNGNLNVIGDEIVLGNVKINLRSERIRSKVHHQLLTLTANHRCCHGMSACFCTFQRDFRFSIGISNRFVAIAQREVRLHIFR